MHRSRPVLVVQGDDHGQNRSCPTVLIMPLSHDTSRQRTWEELIANAETPLPDPSIVKVHLIQPIPRSELVERSTYEGDIQPDALRRIYAHLILNLGLT